jgi:phage/plasmid-like protein (TIGR03299 family)
MGASVLFNNVGCSVEQYSDYDEMFKYSGLDYEVIDEPVYNFDGVGVPNCKCTTNTSTGKPIGIVGSNYEVIQNKDVFGCIKDHFNEITPVWSGALDNGKVAYLQCKINKTIELGKGDTIDRYIFLSNSFDGSSSIRILFTPIRQVCDNMLSKMLRQQSILSIKHTRSANEKILNIPDIMVSEMMFSNQLGEYLTGLSTIQVSNKVVSAVIMEHVAGIEGITSVKTHGGLSKVPIEEISVVKRNIINTMYSIVESGKGQNYHRGTALWLYNGISTYYNNNKNYSDASKQLMNLVNGNVPKLMNNVQQLITKYC